MKWSNSITCMAMLAAMALVLGANGATANDAKASAQAGNNWKFDDQKAGNVPVGWKVAETGKAKPAKWEVITDATAPSAANVVALTKTENTGETFNLLLAEGPMLKDVSLEAKVKVLSGKNNQGSGLVWRAVDPNNYYLARWTALSNNFRVYCMKDGKAKRLANVNIKLDPKAWHTIHVNQQGDSIVASLDGKELIKVKDATLPKAGMIGLCTKADAAAAFDDVQAHETQP